MENNNLETPFFPPYLGLEISDEVETAEDRVRKYIEASRSEETVRKTEFWIRRLREHGHSQTGEKSIECM